jgi:phospholipase/carboxylesterase
MLRTRRSVPPCCSYTLKFDPSLEAGAAACSLGSLDFPHARFAPLRYTPGYAYPLIVWLHGRGSDERQLQRIMPLVSMQNYVAVAPRGIQVSEPAGDAPEGYHWLQSEDHIPLAEQRVFDSIELAADKYHVERRRIFLCGFDMGGTMALRVAMNHPDRFAGVISLCGAFPAGGTPFGNLIAARRLGVFLASGRASNDYPAAQVCEDLRLLHTAGLSVTLRQYPCGQELMPQMLADVNRWIMEQINPRPAADAETDAEWSHEAE